MRGTLSRYKSIFIDEDYPSFIDKYLATKSLTRLSHVTFSVAVIIPTCLVQNVCIPALIIALTWLI